VSGTLLWGDQRGRLVVTHLDGSVVRRLQVHPEAGVSMSPSGSQVAVTDSALHLVDLATGSSTQLVAKDDVDGSLGIARFSADGRYLAVAYDQSTCLDQQPRAGIVLVDLATSTRMQRPVWPRARPWRRNAFTRFVAVEHVTNAGEVAFRETRYTYGECRYQELVEERLWSVPRNAADPHLLVREGELGDVALSPDEARLAFAVGRGDECELRVAAGNGTRPRLVAYRSYAALGCSRGLRGLSLLWAPNAGRLYYGDGSGVYVWDAGSATTSLLLRPPGSPAPACMANQQCIQHPLHATSTNGAWLLLEQSDPFNYKAVPKRLLVNVARRTTRDVRSPRGRYELVAAQLR
jgi:hypothetical protein